MKHRSRLGWLLILVLVGVVAACGEEGELPPAVRVNSPPAFAGLASVTPEDGSYRLAWALASDDATAPGRLTYSIYVADAPAIAGVDFSAPVLTVTGGTSAAVPGFDPLARRYFIVRACDEEGACDGNTLLQTARAFGFDAAPNFRDLGGYVNAEGRQIRWNRVFRSGELSDLGDEELRIITSFGFRRFMDLREPAEIARDGTDRTYPGNEGIYDLLEFNVGDPYLLSAPADPGNPLSQLLWDVRRVDYPNWYVNVLESNKDGIRRAFERFADPSQYPMLFHCTQGKDRAGVLSALLLLLLDVTEETIIEDYVLTCELTASDIEEKLDLIGSILPNLSAAPPGVSAEDWRPMLECHREAMENLIRHVQEEYGGIEGFLESIGIGAARQDAIKNALLSE